MSSGYSYNTYMNWDIWVPVGVSILTILFVTLIVIVSIIWFKVYRSSAHHCIELTYHFAKLVLRDALQRNLEAAPPRMTLYDRRVSPVSVILLSSLAPAVFIPSFVSFWASFLVDETYACDPGLDCFSRNSSSFVIDYQDPLTTCTDLSNDTVVCFQFVFDYVAGFASMGGFLVVAVISTKVYGIVLVWLVGIMPSPHDGRHGKCYSCRAVCSIVGVFSFFLAPIIIATLILSAALLQPFINDVVFQSNERVLNFAAYWSSLLFAGTVTGVCILVTVIGSHFHRANYHVSGADRDRDLEAGFSASFNMSATNPLHQSNKTATTTTNLNSLYTNSKSAPQPISSEPPAEDPPKLVESFMSSYRDVTSLSPRHTESSQLLSATKSSDNKYM